MLTGIDDIHLYGDGGEDTKKAQEFLSEHGVDHVYLHYGDPVQHESVFSSIRTWFPERVGEIEAFPFVVYTEVQDGVKHPASTRRILHGLDEILDSNLPDLVKL